MAGSAFVGRDFKNDSGNVLNNPLIAGDAWRETLAQSPWAGLSTDIDPINMGLVTAVVNTGATSAVKSVDIPETAGSRQMRFAYQKEITALPGSNGQVIPALGDKNQFLFFETEIAEVRSPQMPVHTSMEQRDGANTLSKFGSSEAMARRNVLLWNGWKHDEDHYNAFLRGACDVYLDKASNNGLEKDVGGVVRGTDGPATPNCSPSTAASLAGSPALHENVVLFDGSTSGSRSNTVIATLSYNYYNTAVPATAADAALARAKHEDRVTHFVNAMQDLAAAGVSANTAKSALTRDSVRGMYAIASRMNIRKLKGKDYDYIWQLDWEAVDQLIGSLDGASADTKYLVGIWKTLAAGGQGGDKLMDVRYSNLVLDGVLLVPDRVLQGYRPADITAATDNTLAGDNSTTDAGNLIFGKGISTQDAWYATSKARAYETNDGTVAVGMFLGDTALVKATSGAPDIMEEEGDFKTGKTFASSTWRTVRRPVWVGKDAATAGQMRNEGSILTLSTISKTIDVL